MLPDIYLVALKLNLKIKTVSENTVYCNCPICDDKKGHLCLDRKKQVWRCNRCGEGGGIIALVEKTYNVNHNRAKEMLQRMDFPQSSNNIKIKHGFSQNKPIASIETRDHVYRKMLNLLPLSLEHLEDLEKRGLSKKAIKALGLKSTPGKINYEIPSMLISTGYQLSGIPGFFKQDGKWAMFCYTSGYFVPFLQNGKIFGLQIRSDTNPKKKYVWFSSTNLNNGTQMKGNVHEISFYPNMEKVCLTEGALKADIASYLYHKKTGRTMGFIAVPGVSNQKTLKNGLVKLKEKGVKEIIEALDMDKCGNITVAQNKEVAIALQKTITTIEDCGLIYTPSTWPRMKGIDDYLLQTRKNTKL